MSEKYKNKAVINSEDIAAINVGTPGHIEHNIKTCPHCGSINAPTVMNQGDIEDCEPTSSIAVVCNASSKNRVSGCGASGGYGQSIEEAIKKWNTRDVKEVDTTEALRLMSELKEVLSKGSLFETLTLQER